MRPVPSLFLHGDNLILIHSLRLFLSSSFHSRSRLGLSLCEATDPFLFLSTWPDYHVLVFLSKGFTVVFFPVRKSVLPNCLNLVPLWRLSVSNLSLPVSLQTPKVSSLLPTELLFSLRNKLSPLETSCLLFLFRDKLFLFPSPRKRQTVSSVPTSRDKLSLIFFPQESRDRLSLSAS